MNQSECEHQLQTDCELLRGLVAGLDRLEQLWNDARLSVKARRRGYFTPDEDDQVRQMLLAYRNYRRALYELIERHAGYEELADPAQRWRSLSDSKWRPAGQRGGFSPAGIDYLP